MKDIIFIGDGLGIRTLPAKMLGLNVLGTDISKWAIEHSLCKENMIQDDIVNTKIKEKAKLVVVYDVLEHIEEKDLDKAIKNIIKIGNKHFVFSICYEDDPNYLLDKNHKIKKSRNWWFEKLSKYFHIKPTPKDWLFHEQILIGEKK